MEVVARSPDFSEEEGEDEEMAFTPGSSGAAVSQVELSISCRGPHDADVFSLSDPMVVVEEMVGLWIISFFSHIVSDTWYTAMAGIGPDRNHLV